MRQRCRHAALREANKHPVAVLNHNKAAFYMIEPELFEALMEEIADQNLYKKVLARRANKGKALDGSVKEVLKKLLAKRLDQPHVPGGALHGELSGHYKIKLNKQGIRLVYAVEDDKLIVMVMAVDKREDSIVYKSALTRMTAKAVALAKMVKNSTS